MFISQKPRNNGWPRVLPVKQACRQVQETKSERLYTRKSPSKYVSKTRYSPNSLSKQCAFCGRDYEEGAIRLRTPWVPALPKQLKPPTPANPSSSFLVCLQTHPQLFLSCPIHIDSGAWVHEVTDLPIEIYYFGIS